MNSTIPITQPNRLFEIPEALPVLDDAPRIVSISPTHLHAPVGPPTGPSEEESSDGGLRPLAYLRYRWVTVLFLGSLVAVLAAVPAALILPAKYTTSSIIRVSPQDPRIYYNEDPHGRSDFASYLKTQAGLFRSHFVITAALRDPEVAALPMLKDQPDPVRFLEEEIQIEFQDGSELIKPRLAGDDPRSITLILNALHDAFFREIVEAERKRKQQRLRELKEAAQKMRGDLEKTPAIVEKQDGSPAESLPGVGPNVAANQVVRLREKLDGVEIRRKQIEDEKKRLLRKLDNPESELPPVPPGFVAQLEGDPVISGINRRTAQWQKQLEYQLTLNADENAAGVKELKTKMAEAVLERERVRKERIEEFRRAQLDDVERRMRQDVEKIDAELEGLTIVFTRVTAELKEYEAKLSKILPAVDGKTPDFGKVDTHSRSEIVGGMMEKINLLQLELAAPSRVQSLQRAAVPMKREMKKQILGTIAAAFVGFLLVAAGVVAYETRVKRAMSLNDVRSAVIGPILGAIPAVQTRTGRPTADLAIAEEAIEKARSALQQQFGKAGSKMVMITSAIGDEGRSFYARETAMSFARAGSRTILVDFDLRTPTHHEFFETGCEPGVCEVLRGDAPLGEAVRPMPFDLSVLPAGRWTDLIRTALTPDRIGSLIEALKAHFDTVIVDTHPILSVAETGYLSRSADAIVLTVEKYESRLPLVTRAHEKISQAIPEAFGVVFLNAHRDECLQ